jgi:hypothetical protein
MHCIVCALKGEIKALATKKIFLKDPFFNLIIFNNSSAAYKLAAASLKPSSIPRCLLCSLCQKVVPMTSPCQNRKPFCFVYVAMIYETDFPAKIFCPKKGNLGCLGRSTVVKCDASNDENRLEQRSMSNSDFYKF